MRFGPLTHATFKTRPNRFLGITETDGHVEEFFIPNPGRLRELLHPGASVYLKRCETRGRRTRWDLALIDHGGVLVSVDSRVPNAVIEESIQADLVPEFLGYRVDRREPSFGDSRLDLRLTNGSAYALVEVKSCTLVVDGVVLFPDAPTERGTRHLRALGEALRLGRSALVFLVQRSDALSLSPNEATDPTFTGALRGALLKGVEVYAYDSKVTLDGITINRRVPVNI
jgi:sugar fermentation stimulation protein A